MNPDGSAANPAAFQRQIRSDSNTMAQLFQVELCFSSSILTMVLSMYLLKCFEPEKL